MAGDFGYGLQDPWSTTHPANELYASIRHVVAQMETMRLVRVQAVAPGAGTPPLAGTVDVLPLVNQVDGLGNATPHGTVHGVPWLRLAGGDSAVILDPAVGDVGYVVCDSRDTSSVRSTGKQANPGSFRLFDLADGVYVGRLLASDPPAQRLWFNAGGLDLLDRNGNKWAGSSGGIDVTPKSGQPHTIHGSAVVTGNEKVGGNLEVDGASDLKGAVHAEGAATVDGELDALKIRVAGGATITRALAGTVTTPTNSMGGGTSNFFTGAVAGARAGDFVCLGAPGAQDSLVTVQAYVSAPDTVTIVIGNPTAGARTTPTLVYNVLVIGTT